MPVSVLDNEPFIKYYTIATCGNGNEIKIWVISSENNYKDENSPHPISVVLKSTYLGHSSVVTSVRYNTAGILLISSSVDKLVKVWDERGRCLVTFDEHTRYVNCVSFSKDSLIAASGNHTYIVIIFLYCKKVRQVRMISQFAYGT